MLWTPSPSVNSMPRNKVPWREMHHGDSSLGRRSLHPGTTQQKTLQPLILSTNKWLGVSSLESTNVIR